MNNKVVKNCAKTLGHRIAACLSVLMLSWSACGADEVGKTQQLVEQWLSLERQNSNLQSDWQQQQPLLSQRIALLEIEKQQLQALLSEKSNNTSQVEQQRLALIEQQSQLEQQQAQMTQAISQIANQLSGMQSQLAPPLLNSWQQQDAQLDEQAPASELLQVALSKLAKLAEFDQRISVIEGTINNQQGEAILVKQLFVGAGHAWFVSVDGSFAGSGQLSDNGWLWDTSGSADADEIAKAIAIFEKQREADFVRLPVSLHGGSR